MGRKKPPAGPPCKGALASGTGRSGPSAAGRPDMKICRMLVCGLQRRGTGEISPRAPCAKCLQRALIMSAKPTGPAGGFDLASFSETPPGWPGRVKRLSLSVSGEARWHTVPKRCTTKREESRLWEAGQVVQEIEYSVPLERLAGGIPFQGLRKPQA